MTRKALAAVVFAALFAGWTSLAIGGEVCVQAAKRYHAVQIQNEDVQLQSVALQQFVQSAVFRRSVADKNSLRAAWARELARAALGDIDLGRVRHEINESAPPGLWRAELGRVFLE